MSLIDWPANLIGSQLQFYLMKTGTQFTSPFNGSMQSTSFAAERWMVMITLTAKQRANSGDLEALANWLAGGINQVRLWNWCSGVRSAPGVPRGTLRGTPALTANVSRGARSIPAAGAAGSTLNAGDFFSVSSMLFQVAPGGVVFDGGGLANIPTVNASRIDLTSGAAIVWNQPKANFYMPAMAAPGTHVPRNYLPPVFDLTEAY